MYEINLIALGQDMIWTKWIKLIANEDVVITELEKYFKIDV